MTVFIKLKRVIIFESSLFTIRSMPIRSLSKIWQSIRKFNSWFLLRSNLCFLFNFIICIRIFYLNIYFYFIILVFVNALFLFFLIFIHDFLLYFIILLMRIFNYLGYFNFCFFFLVFFRIFLAYFFKIVFCI